MNEPYIASKPAAVDYHRHRIAAGRALASDSPSERAGRPMSRLRSRMRAQDRNQKGKRKSDSEYNDAVTVGPVRGVVFIVICPR